MSPCGPGDSSTVPGRAIAPILFAPLSFEVRSVTAPSFPDIDIAAMDSAGVEALADTGEGSVTDLPLTPALCGAMLDVASVSRVSRASLTAVPEGEAVGFTAVIGGSRVAGSGAELGNVASTSGASVADLPLTLALDRAVSDVASVSRVIRAALTAGLRGAAFGDTAAIEASLVVARSGAVFDVVSASAATVTRSPSTVAASGEKSLSASGGAVSNFASDTVSSLTGSDGSDVDGASLTNAPGSAGEGVTRVCTRAAAPGPALGSDGDVGSVKDAVTIRCAAAIFVIP
jgi:hypothetical protein